MTIDEIKARRPDTPAGVINRYGPIFANMAENEVLEWIELVIKGDEFKAASVMVKDLSPAGLLAEWSALDADWEKANKNNQQSITNQREALALIVRWGMRLAVAAL